MMEFAYTKNVNSERSVADIWSHVSSGVIQAKAEIPFHPDLLSN
jgi:hypothetical protein